VGRTVDIPLPEVLEPLLKPARYKGLFGGRGGAKSHGFGDLLIDDCITHPGLRAVCVREYQVTLQHSVKGLLADKIKKYGLEREFRVLTSQIETPGGGIIIFQGMQDHTADSIKSLEGFDCAWVEEAQNLSERSLKLLRPTIRKPGSEIWCSWNPRFPTDPVDRLLRGPSPPPDSIVIETSFKDNPFFPDVLRREMEYDRGRDVEMYDHVWLGGYEQHSEARVFKNWKIEEFDEPADATYYYGGDWGFSVDPSVLVRCHLDGRKLYISREAYQIGVEIDHLPQLFDQVPGARDWTITADSARPETISYLQRHGFPKMVAAVKGKDSVKEGVIFLQGYDIVVHPRCAHAINELTHYSFVVDKASGMVTPKLADKKNHVIDSLRYAVERLRANVFDYANAGMTSAATW
jgi:phage terminase large subunit